MYVCGVCLCLCGCIIAMRCAAFSELRCLTYVCAIYCCFCCVCCMSYDVLFILVFGFICLHVLMCLKRKQ